MIAARMASLSLRLLLNQKDRTRDGVHRNTIIRAETEATAHGHAVVQVVRTLEAAGVEFPRTAISPA